MYDWANSAFVTTITAAVLPVYYASVSAADLAPNIRTAYWSYTTTIALLIVALMGPVMGAMADFNWLEEEIPDDLSAPWDCRSGASFLYQRRGLAAGVAVLYHR